MIIKIEEKFCKKIQKEEILEDLKKFSPNRDILLEIKSQKNYKILSFKFKPKIKGKIKNFFKIIIKGRTYEKILEENNIKIFSFLLGIDEIVYPKEFLKIETILRKNNFIPFKGLEKGINYHLKFKEFKKAHFLIISNQNFNDFFVEFLKLIIKDNFLHSLEFDTLKGKYCLYITLKNLDINLPLNFMNEYLKSIFKIIFVEKFLRNKYNY